VRIIRTEHGGRVKASAATTMPGRRENTRRPGIRRSGRSARAARIVFREQRPHVCMGRDMIVGAGIHIVSRSIANVLGEPRMIACLERG
jgi:hypothetical protein